MVPGTGRTHPSIHHRNFCQPSPAALHAMASIVQEMAVMYVVFSHWVSAHHTHGAYIICQIDSRLL